MTTHIYDEKIYDIVDDVQEWWNGNCLYLHQNSRDALFRSYMIASSHKTTVRAQQLDGKDRKDVILGSWHIIMKPGRTLQQDIDLPVIQEELDAIEAESKKHNNE